MAQVRKFQEGDGMLTINGKQYTAQQINDYINQAGFDPEERAAIAGTVNAIASGAQVSLDRNANSLSGDNIQSYFSGFYGNDTKAQNNVGRSAGWARRQARWNTRHNTVNHAISKLGGIEDYYTKKKEEQEAQKTRLYKGSDTNGFYTSDGRFLEGPENSQNISRITAIFDALQSGDLSKYDLQDWSGDTTLSGLTDWYAAQNGKFNREEFFKRLRENKLTEVDWEVLAGMGFIPGTTPQADSKTSHVDWKGNANAAKRAGVYFTKNSDGTWSINGNQDYLNNTWYAGGLDFLTGTDFEGGAIHNGKLYTRQQVLNNDPSLGGAFQTWMNARTTAKDHRSWYDLANASGVRFVGDRMSRGTGSDDYGIFSTQFNPNTHYNEHWSNYFSGLGLGNRDFDVADMSTAYTNLNGRQVLAYIDPNNTYDDMGIRSVKYVVKNADGTYNTYNSEAELISKAGLTVNQDAYGFTPGEIRRDLWETIGNKKYHFAYDLVTIGDQNNVIMQGEDGKFYLARKNGDQHLDPRLIKNEELLKQILENPQNYKNADIEQLTKNPSRSWFRNNSSEGTVAIPGDWATTREATWNGYTVSEKQGGSIPAIKPLPEKFQYGGNVGKTTTTTKDNSTEGKRTDITATHKTNGSDGGLTNAEKMQIAAAVGDLVGVGATFVPGYGNIAGSVLGLGSTATRFVADVKKDGFQGKDFWSALGGAALDVASLVPILGTGAKTAKAVKALKAAATPIMKVLSIAGAVNGVKAMGKVIRGEEVTSEDITAILSGIGSTAIAGKQLKDTIDDARLARHVAQKAKASITGETLGQTLPKSRKEISELLETAGTEKKAIEKIKELLGNDATDDIAKNVLREWGVDTNQSRFKGKNGWKEYLKFWKKGDVTVSIETPDTNVKSVLGYTLNPFARAKQLGYDIGYKQSSGNLGRISKTELNDAYNAVASGIGTGKQIALVRHTTLNPSAFGFKLGPAKNINSGWGWPIYGRNIASEPIDPRIQAEARRMMYASLDDDIYANGPGLPRFAQRIDDEYFGQGLPMDYISHSNDFMPARMLAWKNGGKIQFAKDGKKITKFKSPAGTIGSQTDEVEPIDWNNITGVGMKAGRIVGELATTFDGIDQQLNYAAQNRDLAKSVHTVNTPEYYGSFTDSGRRAAYEQSAAETESQANLNLTSDSYQNRLFRRQAASEARQLRLNGRLAQSEEYSKFIQNLLARKAAYAEQRTANLNNDNLRHLSADVAYNTEASKAVALTTDGWKNAIADTIGIYNDQKTADLQSQLVTKQREFQDWYNAEKAKYDNNADIDKTAYPSFDSYLEATPALKQSYRSWQDAISRIQQQAILYRKKGGTMRPTSEQIKIDKEKAKHKAINQLSKQAFEILKMSLK